jgi:hypothetical protein
VDEGDVALAGGAAVAASQVTPFNAYESGPYANGATLPGFLPQQQQQQQQQYDPRTGMCSYERRVW